MISESVKKDDELKIYEKIHRLSNNLINDEHDACDLTQEVFLELEKERKKWDEAQSKLAWALGVFNRQLKRFWRLKQRQKKEKIIASTKEDTTSIVPAEEQVIYEEQLERAVEIIKELNGGMAQALLLFTIEQMPLKKIAELQKVPVGTVKWRIFEARRIISARLEDEDT